MINIILSSLSGPERYVIFISPTERKDVEQQQTKKEKQFSVNFSAFGKTNFTRMRYNGKIQVFPRNDICSPKKTLMKIFLETRKLVAIKYTWLSSLNSLWLILFILQGF